MDVVLDDRLLIEALTVGLNADGSRLFTTNYWYYRACRAAVLGAGGHLSGPFDTLGAQDQMRAIAAMLRLPDDVGLPHSREVVPLMIDVASRHPALNLMNLEAVAAARVLGAEIWLSPPASRGALPPVLDQEGIRWRTIST